MSFQWMVHGDGVPGSGYSDGTTFVWMEGHPPFLLPNVMHILRPWQNTCKVSKRSDKNCRSCVYMIPSVYVLVEVEPKNDEFKLGKKWSYLIWGLQPNVMHILIPWKKTPAKFKNDPTKTVQGVEPKNDYGKCFKHSKIMNTQKYHKK